MYFDIQNSVFDIFKVLPSREGGVGLSFL